jgi:hypothetical protein
MPEGMRLSYLEMLTCLEMESGAELGGEETPQPRIGRSPAPQNRRL